MHAMNHPEYRYKPWTAERRKRASKAAKARWATQRAQPHLDPSATIAECFSRGPPDWQRELMQAWLNLIVLYRASPDGDREFMNMLADVWQEMAEIVADDLRQKAQNAGLRRAAGN